MNKNAPIVCVIGIWHLGAVNAVGFVEKGYRVIGLEFDPLKAKKLQRGKVPIFEPGLQEMMTKHLGTGSLSFKSNASIVTQADYVVIAYDSPVNEKDEVDINPVVDAANAVATYLKPQAPLVITSQIPLGTSDKIEFDLKRINPQWQSGVVYTPENLKLGSATAPSGSICSVISGAPSWIFLGIRNFLQHRFHYIVQSMERCSQALPNEGSDL